MRELLKVVPKGFVQHMARTILVARKPETPVYPALPSAAHKRGATCLNRAELYFVLGRSANTDGT